MAAVTYDFVSLGPVEGGVALSTSGTSAKDSAVVAGSAATISPGDPVVYANGYWAKVSDGGGASAGMYGLAMSTSTDTAGADGLVKVAYHPSGLLVKGAPTTAGNLAQGILGDLVTFDVSTGVVKVDENDAGAGVLRIVDYDNSVSGNEKITVVLPYNTTPA